MSDPSGGEPPVMATVDAATAVVTPRPRMGRSVAYVTVAAAVFVASGYVVNVWLGRLLGPEDYGRFAVVIAIMTLLNVAQNASVPQALARAVAREPTAARALLRTGLVLQVGASGILALAMLVGAPIAARLLGDRVLESLLRTAAVVLIPYGMYTVLVAYQNGLGHHGRQAAGQAMYAVAKVAGAVGFAYGLGVAGGILGYALAAIAGALVIVAMPSSGPAMARVSELVRFAGPHMIYALAAMAQFSVDILLVTALRVEAEAPGLYAAAQNIARIPYFLLTGLAVIILPAVARAVRADDRSAVTTVRQALRVAFIVVLPLAAVVVGTSRGAIGLLYGSRYAAGSDELAVLAVGMAALAVASVAGAALSGLGHPGRSAAAALTGLAATTAGGVALVPTVGSLGAALAMTAGAALSLSIVLLQLGRALRGCVPVPSLVRALAAGGVVAVGLWLLAPGGPAVVVAGLAGLAGALVLLVVGGEVDRADLHRVRAVVRAG